MISSKVSLTLVGGFVIAALVTLVGTLALLAGRTGPTDEYYTVYSNVSGLKFGSQVLYEGYPVGQVERIIPVFEEGKVRFRVEMSVTEGWHIPKDSVARSEASGILAPQTIEIIAGASPTPLKPGDMIRPGASLSLMSSVSSAAGTFDELTDTGLLPLVENLNKQVDTLGVILNQDLRPLLTDARVVMAKAQEHLPSMLQHVDQASADISGVTHRVSVLLDDKRIAKVDQILSDASETAANLREASAELDGAIKSGSPNLLLGIREFRLVMESLSRYSEPFAQNLESTTRNLEDFSRQLRQNPSLLLRSGQPEDQAEPAPPLKRKEDR